MGQKDITEKILADYNDVFADIVNVLLFEGKQVVDPNALESVKDKSQYKAQGKIHEEERDVSKVVKNHQRIRITFLGLEHQTEVDKDEPFRVIGYDGASYRAQLLSDSKERYPVVTLVLYFGMTRWNKATSLFESLEISDEWKPFVNDYKINLFEIAFLKPEQVDKFQSDFRIIADYLVQKRMNNDYVPSREELKHMDEVLKLMSVVAEDERFEDVQKDLHKEGGAKNMCDVLDRIENKGRIEGKIEGKIEAYYDDGKSVEEIAYKVGISAHEVEAIMDALNLRE